MKKIFLILMMLQLLMINICAEDYSEQGTYTIGLSVINPPTYSVKIPKSINVSDETTNMTFYVKGDIFADQKLNVIFDKSTTLSNGTSSVPVTITQDKESWSYGELSDAYLSSAINITHRKLSAGIWNGHLTVRISLQET